jgi:GR25 family glycosyltransferase involved in LPS biosynthesis
MRIYSLLMATKAAWFFGMYLIFHLCLWSWNGNERHYLREISTVFNERSASIPDRAFVDSTANNVPLLLKDPVPSKSDFAMDSPKTTAATTPKRRNHVESFVISFDTDNAEQFKQRNDHSGLGEVLWVPSVDGYQQNTLDTWAKLTGGGEAMNATHYTRGNQEQKDDYRSPHAVGCYLAHYHLLRYLHHRTRELRPSLYFVFEDDASCAPNLVDKTLEVTQKLPPNWDLFFIGGKPITFFSKKFTLYKDSSNQTLERDVCRGAFGRGSSPLSPEGSRTISQHDDYWKIKYLTNTHAYVINPSRLHHVMKILKPTYDVPIDIMLANAMQEGRLNAYMPTQEWCSGDISPSKQEKPEPWYGFYIFMDKAGKHPHLPEWKGIWQAMAQENCPY